MITTLAEDLWVRLNALLETFAEKVTKNDSTLICRVVNTTNKAYLLRGYLSFMKHEDGNEVAITLGVQTNGKELTAVSDVCTDEGVIIADGPSTTISLSGNQPNIKVALDEWLDKFGRFLEDVEPTVITSVSKL